MHKDAAGSGTFAAGFDWNEVRFVLAVARHGTLAGASAELGVDQTTVSRRLKALERRLGVQVFERRLGRLVATGAGERLLEHGRRVEGEMAALADLAGDVDAQLRGITRITAVDSMVSHYLAPLVAEARTRFPTLVLEIVAGNHNLDLGRREADIAIRLARPSRGDLVIRRLGEMAFGVYGARDRHGGPAAWPFDPAYRWLAYERDMMDLPEMRWLGERIDAERIVFRSNALDALIEVAVAGTGLVLLPCILGDARPALQRLPATVPGREMWMAMARELRDVPRVRAVCDWLVARFQADAARFRGQAAPD
ncbi:MAG: LysR family transcriptional regulator [Rhodocyclaceae bacterium]|nr:LysR family transcriptional regulator [Rhodocyclaceae bacterium]